MNYKHLYQRFLSARPQVLHFACHSHHYWPDVTRDAMLEYWDDTANMVDDKWSHIFSTKLPAVQRMIADTLNVADAQRVVFAPNTHELLYRIHSTFEPLKKVKVLTTDSEFYSFQRQSERWLQQQSIELVTVPTEPFDSFEQRFIEAAAKYQPDWIFVSQVFFNSGFAIANLAEFVAQLPTDALITIDGYHGFFALPTDLSQLEHRIFYLAGGYKYAQGGEGVCFAIVPDGEFQPIYTGWFAEFGELHARKAGQVQYAKGGQAFAGATMDMSALYRLHAALTLFNEQGLDVPTIHKHIERCQQQFLERLDEQGHSLLNRKHLLAYCPLKAHGHFLTFKLPEQDVARLAAQLAEHNIVTDYRGDRLRFGFAIYHDPNDYDFSILSRI